MKKNENTTVGKYLKSMSPERRKKFEQTYKEHLISEMLIAAMHNDDVSVRELAKRADVSPAIVQALRSGTKKNITIKTISKIMKPFGFSVALVKDDLVLPFESTEKADININVPAIKKKKTIMPKRNTSSNAVSIQAKKRK